MTTTQRIQTEQRERQERLFGMPLPATGLAACIEAPVFTQAADIQAKLAGNKDFAGTNGLHTPWYVPAEVVLR